MRRICRGCGYEIPDDSDFCHRCGEWADKALNVNDEGTVLYSDRCSSCGEDLPPGADFCPHCGASTAGSNINLVRRPFKLTTNNIIAILLAVVPGFFNVFGLGQIYQRRWSKAFMFLAISALLIYVAPSFLQFTNTTMLLILIQVAMFMFSLSDVFGAIVRGEA
jgi:RNA polymerase subunit RPABC4/transcription elongation factor Spt4